MIRSQTQGFLILLRQLNTELARLANFLTSSWESISDSMFSLFATWPLDRQKMRKVLVWSLWMFSRVRSNWKQFWLVLFWSLKVLFSSLASLLLYLLRAVVWSWFHPQRSCLIILTPLLSLFLAFLSSICLPLILSARSQSLVSLGSVRQQMIDYSRNVWCCF